MTPLERLVQRREHFAAAVGNEHVVLNADAAFAGEVDAGLDGHDHAWPELFFAADLAHHRQLVNLAPDAVTQTMAELLPESGLVDHVARHLIRLPRRHAGAQKVD